MKEELKLDVLNYWLLFFKNISDKKKQIPAMS